MLTLRPYQSDALAAIRDAQQRGVTRMVVQMPCGGGKTVLFAHLVAQELVHGRVIILCHRDELIGQSREKLRDLLPDVPIGVVKAASDERDTPVVLASVQTLARSTRLERLSRNWCLIVCDEQHHAYGHNSWVRALEWLSGPGGQTLTVGFSATPFQANGTPVVGDGQFFQEIVYHKHLLEMIECGYLVMPRAMRLKLDGMSLKNIARVAGDYSASALEDRMLSNTVRAPEHLAQGIADHALGRRTIVFSPGVMMAEAVTASCLALGISATTIVGETPRDVRQRAYQQMRAGEMAVLSSCAVLTEGFDLPEVDTVLMARATRSKVLYQQTIGRALRLSPQTGKLDALILDATGCTERNNLFSMAEMLGLVKPAPPGEDTEDDDERLVIEDDEDDTGDLEQKLLAEHVRLLRQSAFLWVQTVSGAFALSLPDQVLLRVRVMGDRALLECKRQRVWTRLATNIPVAHAFGIGEDTARGLGCAQFSGKNAAWLLRPASEKQVAFARKLRIAIDPAWTAGECSDAITRVVADW